MNAYFDMFSGISGNMVLGALLDLGLELEDLQQELDKLGLSNEFDIKSKRVIKEGISGTYVNVELLSSDNLRQGSDCCHGGQDNHEHSPCGHEDHHCHGTHEHSHEAADSCHGENACQHHHKKHEHLHGGTQQDQGIFEYDQGDVHGEPEHDHHHGRNLADINEIVDNSSLSDSIKEKSKAIFLNLARAEAKIHGTDINEIHFHEVGAVDAIVDIVGSVIGLELLNVNRIFASNIHTGTGFVKCAHGMMPLPAPATMELLNGIPVYSTGIKSELVTPTGAAIISTLAEDFGERPEMVIEKTGYGAGSRDLEIPNLLRVNLGQVERDVQKKT